MASGYSKSKVISVYNGVSDSASPAQSVDLAFGDVVAIDVAGSITGDGPTVVDGYNQGTRITTYGVVTGKKGIPAGQSGPVCVAGECFARVLGTTGGTIAVGAFLDIGTTQENGSGAGLSFQVCALDSARAIGALDTTADDESELFAGRTRARLVDGQPADTTTAVLLATAVQHLAIVNVFNNPSDALG